MKRFLNKMLAVLLTLGIYSVIIYSGLDGNVRAAVTAGVVYTALLVFLMISVHGNNRSFEGGPSVDILLVRDFNAVAGAAPGRAKWREPSTIDKISQNSGKYQRANPVSSRISLFTTILGGIVFWVLAGVVISKHGFNGAAWFLILLGLLPLPNLWLYRRGQKARAEEDAMHGRE